MTLMHKLLAGAMRAAGRHRDAAEIEEAGTPEPSRRPAPPEAMPESGPVQESRPSAAPSARIATGDDHKTAARAAAGAAPSAGGAGGGAAPTAEGGIGSAGGEREAATGGGGSRAGGTRPEAEESEQEKAQDPSRPSAILGQAQAPGELPGLDSDPLAGLHSERLRERLERDAFRAASGDAQDSAIWRSAVRTLPPDVLIKFQPGTPHPGASSRAARAARIDALRGQIPDWARGDPQNDPTLLHSAQPRARGRAAPQRAAAPTPTLAPARASEVGRER